MSTSAVDTLEAEIVDRFHQLALADRRRVLHKLLDSVVAEPSTILDEDEATYQSRLAARERVSGFIKDDITDASQTVKETVREYMRRKYGDTD